MSKVAGVLLGALVTMAGTAALAGENPLIGTWKLKSFVREVAATGERYNERGEHPPGFLSYSADGRMYAIITWDNRANPHDVVPTDEERIKLYGTMISYAAPAQWMPRRSSITSKFRGIKLGPTAARAEAFWCAGADIDQQKTWPR